MNTWPTHMISTITTFIKKFSTPPTCVIAISNCSYNCGVSASYEATYTLNIKKHQAAIH